MASLTKLQTRTLVQQLIDDQGGLWTAGNLDVLIELAIDSRWAKLLSNAPFLVSQLDTLTPTSPGYIDVNAGGLTRRFHKLQSIVRDSRTYRAADPRDVVLSGNAVVSARDFTYAFYGGLFWLFPLSVTPNVEFRYSYKPTAYTSLTEGATITWPNGHEDAYVYEAAARANMKGNYNSAVEFKALANEAMDDLITAVKRPQIGPGAIWSPTTAIESGSV